MGGRRRLMKSAVLVASLSAVGGLQACIGPGAATVTRSSTGNASVVIDHTMSGIAYKTFAASLEAMRSATLTGLGELEFAVTVDDSTEQGRAIEATAKDRRISIDLEALSPSATRMQVRADRTAGIFRDRATATEIIVRTAAVLDGRRHASAAH